MGSFIGSEEHLVNDLGTIIRNHYLGTIIKAQY